MSQPSTPAASPHEIDRLLPARLPRQGELVYLRSRQWLVEGVTPADVPDGPTTVHLACADDDNQGQTLEVYWELELDRQVLAEENWAELATRGFDSPRRFAAFLHTLRWNCVTATEPNLFQAPFRAGIKIDAYQMEPLRKALRLPRVNLFIADDTGLGKTIEAGLIARELLLRKKAKSIVVATPPSVLEQWKAELEERFGLIFEILDRDYFARMRRERGFGVNPWATHSRFLVSHNLLIDPTYADPLRSWLGDFQAGSLLILDEAHHAAPASGGRYGIETKFTKAIRDLAQRFEHRLFLSATPHNGHSNSFSTLLELLDPYRFTRGVRVLESARKEVMVRRLKEDIRAIQGGFPKRQIVRVAIDGLPHDAPELELSRLLDAYRTAREARFAAATKRQQATAALTVVGLQQRLLSSVEAFARSLRVHRASLERRENRPTEPTSDLSSSLQQSLIGYAETDDAVDDDQLGAEDDRAMEAATLAAPGSAMGAEERDLLDRMQAVAERHRHEPDAKFRYLIDWIREHLCPGLPPIGRSVRGQAPSWNPRRVLIFTENREGTKRYLRQLLMQAIEGTDRADERIEVIDGLTSSQRRKEIQRRFNTDPARDPLRILLATDAAREGLNFQAHCADLFHYDLPWNPGRIEQRNGRIDRKLQPEPEVRCHYFVLPQRAEDRVLEVLVRKTETIQRELGSLSKVIENHIEKRLQAGIRHRDVEQLALQLDADAPDQAQKQQSIQELEDARDRGSKLEEQIGECRTLLERSRSWIDFRADAFRDALSVSLEMLGASPLQSGQDEEGRPLWTVPDLSRRAETDSSWTATLDTLRPPRRSGETLADWRRTSPIRPVVFEDAGRLTEDTVHLHLDQRVAQRLLARFRAQGFRYHDLSRACLVQAKDAIPRVILLGRLSLYGSGAERLHEQLVPITARWIELGQRKGPLSAYAADTERKTIDLLHETLSHTFNRPLDAAVQAKLLAAAPRDIEDLLALLETRATEVAAQAEAKLVQRGEAEARSLSSTLEAQRERVRGALAEVERRLAQGQLAFEGTEQERDQHARDVEAWRRRIQTFDADLLTEPARVRDFYTVQARRVEPVGLVYLWPESN